MNHGIESYLMEYVPQEDLLKQEPMHRHTSFRCGGEAEYFIRVRSISQLQKLLRILGSSGFPYFVMGNGTNLLVGDKGYRGVILQIGEGLGDIRIEGTKVIAGAGALLSAVSKKAAKAGLTGLEFASGIPGNVGGALAMNAGAYGGEMSQVVRKVRVIDRKGELLEFDRDTMEFSYRYSVLRQYPFVAVETELELASGDPGEIQAKMDELAVARREKQPLEYPSAGSTFKRPKGHFAGKLIMDCGLRGYRIGGAQVSEKHCGFIVNVGNATAADVAELIEEVQEKVKERFRVRLEPEVISLGEF